MSIYGRGMSARVGGMFLFIGIAAISNGEGYGRADKVQETSAGHSVKASELIGLGVRTSGDEEKGKIKDLMLGPDGRVEYAAVSFGGFMGMGDRLFAVPMEAIRLEWKDNKISHAKVDLTEEYIKQRSGFDSNHWPEHGDNSFIARGRAN